MVAEPSIIIHCSAPAVADVVATKTRSSADADNRLDAFSASVEVNKHGTIPHVTYSFLLCNCNFVFKIFVFKKFHDLEMGSKVTQGH